MVTPNVPTMGIRTKLLLVITALAAAYAAWFCYEVLKPPVVVFTNASSETLRNLVVSGDKFTERAESVAPHSTVSWVVDARGQADFEVGFMASRGEVRKSERADIQPAGRYVAHVTVDEKLNVAFDFSHFTGHWAGGR